MAPRFLHTDLINKPTMPRRGYIAPDDPNRPDRWREGTNLPHWDGRYIPQSVTFRLYDSVPDEVIETWKKELKNEEDRDRQRKLYKRIERYMDQGYGECWLEDARVAELVDDGLLHFDGTRYELHAWVVMPNHVHVLLSMIGDVDLGDVLHSWKSYTAHEANDVLDRSGEFWADDYFDRYIRNDEHFSNVVGYIEANPVTVGLCEQPEDWRWSSAYHKSQGLF